jgi:signal transduction histidine kinase
MVNHKDVAFDGDKEKSGLEPYLPAGTRAQLIMPFSVPDTLFFVIIAISSVAHYKFQAEGINLVRSMGSILRAQVMQNRVKEADAAKTAFLSSISHELRTPLYGVMTGLELVNKAVEMEDWPSIKSVLPTMQSSSQVLSTILNDVLDFGKQDIGRDKAVAPSETIDLIVAATYAAMVCASQYLNTAGGASLSFEYEDRDWNAAVEPARFSR